MKICNKYQKNFDAISETFWRRFQKNFVKYSENRRNSRIDYGGNFRKTSKSFWIDWKVTSKKNFGEILGDFNELPMNFQIKSREH